MTHLARSIVWALAFLFLFASIILVGVAALGLTQDAERTVVDLHPLAVANLFLVNLAILAAAIWHHRSWVLLTAIGSLLLDASTRVAMGVAWVAILDVTIAAIFAGIVVARHLMPAADPDHREGWDGPTHHEATNARTTTWTRTTPTGTRAVQRLADGRYEASIAPTNSPQRWLGTHDSFEEAEQATLLADARIVAPTDTVEGWIGPNPNHHNRPSWQRPVTDGTARVAYLHDDAYMAALEHPHNPTITFGTFPTFVEAVRALARHTNEPSLAPFTQTHQDDDEDDTV